MVFIFSKRYDINELPIRDEIFSSERLNQYAQFLAENIVVNDKMFHDKVLRRVDENNKVFLETYRDFVDDLGQNMQIPSAGMWIVDNHYIIEEQFLKIKHDLPRKYYDELPKIDNGELKGYPRVYSLALTLVAHLDSHLDLNTVLNFISSFQGKVALTSGEIWAIPISLRIALLENLRRILIQLVYRHRVRNTSRLLAERILQGEIKEREFAERITSIMNDSPFSASICIGQLYKQLREQSPESVSLNLIVRNYLDENKISIDDVLNQEHLQDALSQVTLGNIVTSMHLISSIEWKEFFEKVSLVEGILKNDPAQVYGQMDFQSRDRYRHVIEKISKKTKVPETEIAGRVIKMASASLDNNSSDDIKSHVGFYLLDKGLREIQQSFGYSRPPKEILKNSIKRHPNLYYFSVLVALQFILLSFFLWFELNNSFALFFSIVAFIPVSDTALHTLNFLTNQILSPELLPKMLYKEGVPDEARTFIVVPTIFKTPDDIKKRVEGLEVHYFSNKDPNFFYAILSDFADSAMQTEQSDEALLLLADQLIAGLNKKYAPESPRFFYFHRPRKWNPTQEGWMGWERKRGKIEEFNRFLKDKDFNPFFERNALKLERALFATVNYVITLDSDTVMPINAAKKMLGVAHHPLNRPRIKYNKLERGYVIYQPRISIKSTSASRSLFSKIYSGNTGIDPYTLAVSDVYQDLYGTGIFVGKGLYALNEFRLLTENKVKENTLLSHDLFEGLLARPALVSDVEFMDDYPAHYEAFYKRLHRWIRGDWQIAKYAFSLKGNHFNLSDRWKMTDNLRRSLLSVFFLLWLIGIFAFSYTPISSLLLLLMALFLPMILSTLSHFFKNLKEVSLSNNLKNIIVQLEYGIIQKLLFLLFLPHQAWLSLDAIVRTLYRVTISGKNLLEWTTAEAAEAEAISRKGPAFEERLAAFVVVVLSVIAVVLHRHWSNLLVAVPFVCGWMLFPQIVQRISRQLDYQLRLAEEERLMLRSMARRTWNFFETFVNQENNWLAPDNFQEKPRPVLAHRTSPTNIGAMMLSTASAYDMGHLGVFELSERLESTKETIEKLERYRGHFYNWYNTTTLQPLYPIYLSTVDSGNFAAFLYTIKIFCQEIKEKPIFGSQLISGLADTLNILREEYVRIDKRFFKSTFHSRGKDQTNEFGVSLEEIFKMFEGPGPHTFSTWDFFLCRLKMKADQLSDILKALIQEHGEKHYHQLPHWMLETEKRINHLYQQMECIHPFPLQWQESQKTKNPLSLLSEEVKLCDQIHTLNEALPIFLELKSRVQDPELQLRIEQSEKVVNDLIASLDTMGTTFNRLAMEMDFGFMYNRERKIFSIGYNLTEGRMDNSYYDLLASEARLASFFAIAKGEIPTEHWFHLGRQMSSIGGRRALISWTASMFEYLMPLLVMKNFRETLLHQTYEAIVKTQQEYTEYSNIPWGVSESAYNARDLQQNYQYGPFGIPGLGLKFGLGADTVISPYSTGLAAMINPRAALLNFQKLIEERAFGQFGFYESIDYTSSRLPKGIRSHVIKSFMVHHQSMILVSLDNVLNENIMQNRFHSDPMIKAAELLLQEKIPAYMTVIPQMEKETPVKSNLRNEEKLDLRFFTNVETSFPQCNVISNGSYTVMTSTNGAGFSRYKDLAITRWSEDSTLESKGSYIYLRDYAEDSISSVTYQPMRDKKADYHCQFSEHKSEFIRKTPSLNVQMEIIVSAEDNVEIRKLKISNHSSSSRRLDLTSYLEPVLARDQDDAAHLSFSKLFLETEFVRSRDALLIKRRKRFHEDKEKWGIHCVSVDCTEYAETEYETDRLRFLGRNRSLHDPMVITENLSLSNTTGTVLDPILSLRKHLLIEPRATVHISFTTGLATTREEALRLIDHYHDVLAFEREQELSWTQNQAKLRHINVDTEEALLFQELSSALIFANPILRPHSDKMTRPKKTQEGLWAFGISGDLPIVTVRVNTERDLQQVRLIIKAHEYFRSKNISFDLVLLNEEKTSYRMTVHDELIRLINSIGHADKLNRPAGIFLLNASLLTPEDLTLFYAYSKIFMDNNKGSLKEQLDRLKLRNNRSVVSEKNFLIIKPQKIYEQAALELPKLRFFNGLGGFTEDGSEYQIYLKKGVNAPAPWINVVANSTNFGLIVSETGSGYTWSSNSRENRLTPWNNDPVMDSSGEALYLRDEETFSVWSPLPWPSEYERPFLISHGQGYTRFQHNGHGLVHETTMFVSMDENIKIIVLKMRNVCPYQRKLSSTFFAEWVLGFNRTQTAPFLVTELEDDVLMARNPFNNTFPEEVAFCAISGTELNFTCDRSEFLGRNSSYASPAGMKQKHLNRKYGAGLDPCAAIRTFFTLGPDEEKEILVLIGQAKTKEKAKDMAKRHLDYSFVLNVYLKAKTFWSSLNDSIQIKTPSAELDLLMNKWVLYQTLSCRIWARTALYQSGGAYGFRDQLQDSLALLYSLPEIARAQILRSASQQFVEGDVQHWWHPPFNKGVRTRFSDDLLWLPYVVFKYLERTQDWSLLDEQTSFIEAPLLKENQEDLYISPSISSESASIYEHCLRAMNRSMKTGVHGLPLMGAGDWNDGMNNVGLEGRGESVWVAWFLSKILQDFSGICFMRGDTEMAQKYADHSKFLTESIEKNAWDGQWYLRAFFDDGTPLGSKDNDECRIDSLTQSWSVLTGLGQIERSKVAMHAVYENLVKKQERLCLLFTPPFDKGNLRPGYIKGYPPGIRENGGQYSHAAAWSAMAFALMNEKEKAFEVLSFLNPVTRTKSYSGLQLYKLEPYALAADIYGGSVHTGRGGWSWYTGSSSLYYQAALEYILGVKIIGGKLFVTPCTPAEWKEYSVELKWKTSSYKINVRLENKKAAVEFDGEIVSGDGIPLIDDGKSHQISFQL